MLNIGTGMREVFPEIDFTKLFDTGRSGYSYPQDRGEKSGVPAARRSAKKRRNIRARSRK